jgi:hypothetical protein
MQYLHLESMEELFQHADSVVLFLWSAVDAGGVCTLIMNVIFMPSAGSFFFWHVLYMQCNYYVLYMQCNYIPSDFWM